MNGQTECNCSAGSFTHMCSDESMKKPTSRPLARVRIFTVPKPHFLHGRGTYQSGPCWVELHSLVQHCSRIEPKFSRRADTEATSASQPFHRAKATRRCTYQSGPCELHLHLLVQHCSRRRTEFLNHQKFEAEANDAAKSA